MAKKTSETKSKKSESGPSEDGAAGPADAAAEDKASKLAETVAAAREKAGAVAGDTLDSTREGLKKAWEQTADFAGEQTKKAQESLANVDLEKSTKATLAAAREAMQTVEKTAEDLTEKLKDFTKRHESEVVSGKLAEEKQMRLGHLAYLLFALAPVTFVSGLFGLILCYLRVGHEEVGGTVLRSHLRWLILTFWIGIGTLLVALLAAWAFCRFVGGLVLLAAAIWFSYRLVKGWLSLYDGKKIASPNALW